MFELVYVKLTILIFFDQICPKWEFPVENRKIALVPASMVFTYYIKLFRTGADGHNGILASLLLLVAETINLSLFFTFFTFQSRLFGIHIFFAFFRK